MTIFFYLNPILTNHDTRPVHIHARHTTCWCSYVLWKKSIEGRENGCLGAGVTCKYLSRINAPLLETTLSITKWRKSAGLLFSLLLRPEHCSPPFVAVARNEVYYDGDVSGATVAHKINSRGWSASHICQQLRTCLPGPFWLQRDPGAPVSSLLIYQDVNGQRKFDEMFVKTSPGVEEMAVHAGPVFRINTFAVPRVPFVCFSANEQSILSSSQIALPMGDSGCRMLLRWWWWWEWKQSSMALTSSLIASASYYKIVRAWLVRILGSQTLKGE